MYLVAALESEGDSPETQMRLCAIAHCALELRGAVSLFSRVHIQERDLIQLENLCLRFFNVVSTMLDSEPHCLDNRLCCPISHSNFI